MLYLAIMLLLLSLSTCFTPSLALFPHFVDIRLSFTPQHSPDKPPLISGTCVNASPGECCRLHEAALLPFTTSTLPTAYISANISFTGLLYGQSGGGWRAWGPRYDDINCSTVPVVMTRDAQLHDGPQETLHTPPTGQEPTLYNMAFAGAWISSGMGRGMLGRPSKWIYPDMYTVNGTDFWKGHDGVFRDNEGKALHLRVMEAL